MSSKIDVRVIFHSHITTLRAAGSSKASIVDVMVFYFLPITIAITSALFHKKLTDSALNAIVTIGALLAGLMLNLLVLIFDRRTKVIELAKANPGQPILQDRANLLQELYFNVCYSTLIALVMTALPVVAMLVPNYHWNFIGWNEQIFTFRVQEHVLTPLLVFASTHMGLTMLMVIKRTFRLLD